MGSVGIARVKVGRCSEMRLDRAENIAHDLTFKPSQISCSSLIRVHRLSFGYLRRPSMMMLARIVVFIFYEQASSPCKSLSKAPSIQLTYPGMITNLTDAGSSTAQLPFDDHR